MILTAPVPKSETESTCEKKELFKCLCLTFLLYNFAVLRERWKLALCGDCSLALFFKGI